jgi:hypothetical protein
MRIQEMAKNTMLKKHKEEDDDFDFSEMLGSSYDDSDETMAGMMSGMLEASNNHMMLALELTKLVVGKNTSKDMNEEEVFSVFKKALGVITESFPLKALWEKLGANE